MKKIAFIALSIACLFTGVGYTADQPIVRAKVSPTEVIVGSEVTLTVTVLVPTWFPKAPVYPSMEMEGVVTVLPPDSTYPMSEQHDGDNWSGITREYKLYPLGIGTFDLRMKHIGLAYADPQTRKPVLSTVPLPDLQFSAVVPAGAENLDPFLAGNSLELSQDMSKESEIYRPGDAVERRITARLEGMPSLFIPSLLSVFEKQGVSIYLGTSSAEDTHREDRKAVTGVRNEAVTYVFERGGIYTFPPVSLRWWNTETTQVETTEIPSIVFQVEKSFAQEIEDLPRPFVFSFILIVFAFLLFIIYSRKSIVRSLIYSWTRFYRSETYAFWKSLFEISFRNDRTAYLGILHWHRRFAPESLHALGSTNSSAILALEASIYGPDSRTVSSGLAFRGKLVSEFFKRRSSIRAKQRSRGLVVSNLNPV